MAGRPDSEPYRADVLLADGGSARIRTLHRNDEPAVRELYQNVSDRTRYLRFLSPLPVEAAVRNERRCIDDPRSFALVVEVEDDVVAIAECDIVVDGDATGEIAFMVQDDWQGRGIGTILLEHLARIAGERGIGRFVATFLLENDAMRKVFADSGYTVSWTPATCGVGEATLELARSSTFQAAHRAREHTAAARSMQRILAPSSIAVVGAGRGLDSIGNLIVRNLAGGGFVGSVYPVNPHARTIAGFRTYHSVAELPGPIDLAVIAVPAAAVLEVVRQCALAGARAVVVISGGFAELREGEQTQRDLVEIARRDGMRVIGPNCVGILNTDPAVRMNATFSPVAAETGRIGFASQSGGVGIELLSRAHALGLGISTFVSLGNRADVSPNDLLQYWSDDPATDVVLLYLESIGDPREFARLARDLSTRKPIVAMKSGRSAAGARGARSHTAALADLDSAIDELFRTTGVIRVDTLEEMFDTAAVLAHQPLPPGRRVAIMSNGGGPGILAADACVAAGLEVPTLSEPTQRALRSVAPPGAGVQNPVDLIAAASADVYRDAARLLLASGEVDAIMVLYVNPGVTRLDDIKRAIADLARNAGEIPVVACFLGIDGVVRPLTVADTSRVVPTFEYPESAANALARAAQLGKWRQSPRGAIPELAVDRPRARERVADQLAHRSEGGWVANDVAIGILGDYGIPVLKSHHATTADDAVAMAEMCGLPVALKAGSRDLLHKTDVGGVVLDLATPRAVRDAFERMSRSLGEEMDGALVQPMASPGVELIVGINDDPQFGPLVLFGAGGTGAELQRDVVLRIPPLTDLDVHEALHALRASPMLFGYRNSPPVDIIALGDLLARVGRLAIDIPEIAELDCNPVVASTNGAVVLDIKIRVAPQDDTTKLPRLGRPAG